jgi:hypothetical protein
VIHRLAYPDGPHDAEALLLSGDGTPVIVTKDPIGYVYVPSAPLQANNREPVKLRKVGAFTPEKTGTPSRFLSLGWLAITGGAVSADGTKALVRTYTDAYEFDVTGGDVAKAVTSSKPRITPLPNEPKGEAISFAPDGKSYLTIPDESVPPSLLRYAPSSANPKASAAPQVPSPTAKKQQSLLSRLTLEDITYIVAGIGVLGLLLVVAGVLGIRHSRASRRATHAGSAAARGAASVPAPPAWGNGEDNRDSHGDDVDGPSGRTGTVYGSASAAAPAVPAGGPSTTPGTVYGNPGYNPGYDQRDEYHSHADGWREHGRR